MERCLGFSGNIRAGPLPSLPPFRPTSAVRKAWRLGFWVSGTCLWLSWSLPPGEYLVVGVGGNASRAVDGVGHRQAGRVAWPSPTSTYVAGCILAALALSWSPGEGNSMGLPLRAWGLLRGKASLTLRGGCPPAFPTALPCL